MPTKTVKRNGVWRVVEVSTGRIATAKKKSGKRGKPRDGGGSASKAHAQKIANAINRNL